MCTHVCLNTCSCFGSTKLDFTAVCFVVWPLSCQMTDRSAKLLKLNDFRRRLPHCTASALASILADVRKNGIPEGSTSRGAFREARDLQNSHASSSQVSSSQASSLQLQPLKSGLRWAWHGGGSMGPDGQPQPQLVRWSMGPDGLGRDEPMYEDNDTLEMPSTKKSSTQKTPTKKSPAKKSSAKKSPAKTSSTKKSSAKKSSTQKNKRL